ncbi:MAG: twin-arginine translocase TatA/TatE family subunit [Chloroflexi bacterium]|nr:MAG: twin-arginine translocase TatA/TatE family subunit [Chloroflexota bacterium]TME46684.1 MAG: twin-arginine translocase TatA/TatE family subunit [Chloroflexota bacterium]
MGGVFGHWYVLLLVLAIVLIVYGPGKLPEVGGAIGRAMREFRKASSDLQDEIKKSTTEQPEPTGPAADRPPVTDVKSPTDTKAS